MREIAREAALGSPRDLPSVAHLDSTVIEPFIRGEVPLPEARLELVRRSAVLFAEDLPPVQVHHGTDDDIVSVSQAESLMRTMDALGRTPPGFEAFIYPGGGHSYFSLDGLIPRSAEFLRDWLASLGGMIGGRWMPCGPAARQRPARPAGEASRPVGHYPPGPR